MLFEGLQKLHPFPLLLDQLYVDKFILPLTMTLPKFKLFTIFLCEHLNNINLVQLIQVYDWNFQPTIPGSYFSLLPLDISSFILIQSS
jgi:hypothetical protein